VAARPASLHRGIRLLAMSGRQPASREEARPGSRSRLVRCVESRRRRSPRATSPSRSSTHPSRGPLSVAPIRRVSPLRRACARAGPSSAVWARAPWPGGVITSGGARLVFPQSCRPPSFQRVARSRTQSVLLRRAVGRTFTGPTERRSHRPRTPTIPSRAIAAFGLPRRRSPPRPTRDAARHRSRRLRKLHAQNPRRTFWTRLIRIFAPRSGRAATTRTRFHTRARVGPAPSPLRRLVRRRRSSKPPRRTPTAVLECGHASV
jgi:hypothetical protein